MLLCRLDFDDDDDNDRFCFALDNVDFVQSNLVTQSDIKTELRLNRFFQGVIKHIKRGILKQCSEADKGFEQQKVALTFQNWNHLLNCAFHSTQTKTHGDCQSSCDSHRQKCKRNSSSNDGLVARHQSRLSSICW